MGRSDTDVTDTVKFTHPESKLAPFSTANFLPNDVEKFSVGKWIANLF